MRAPFFVWTYSLLKFKSTVGTTRGAAALSIFYHGAFAAHLVFLASKEWDSFVDPSGPSGINVRFFLISHGMFTALAALLLVLPVPAAPNRRKEA